MGTPHDVREWFSTWKRDWVVSVFQMACFRRSFCIACSSTIIGAALHVSIKSGLISERFFSENVDNSGYASFLWFCGTLLVFRTSQSYGRFWEGTTLVHQMLGHWTDFTAVVFSFTKHSEQEQDRVRIFKHTVVRLVSLLNAMILADLEGSKENTTKMALNFELLDVEGLDHTALDHLQHADGQHLIPLMVFQWLHNLIVQEISTGVLSIPAPLLTRVFQAMNQAMLSYEDARKYANTPFPFPYTAAMEIVLTVHFFLTPLMVSSWELELPGALCFNFFLVFMMWLLHLVPSDFENPFAVQLTGLDTEKLQNTMNEILVNLMTDPMDYCPHMSAQVTCGMADENLLRPPVRCLIDRRSSATRKSFSDVFLAQMEIHENAESVVKDASSSESSLAEQTTPMKRQTSPMRRQRVNLVRMDGMPVEFVEEHSGESLKSIMARLGRLQFVGPLTSEDTYSSRSHQESLSAASVGNLVGDVVGGGEQLGGSANAVTAVHSTLVEVPDCVGQTRSRVHSSGREEEAHRVLHPL